MVFHVVSPNELAKKRASFNCCELMKMAVILSILVNFFSFYVGKIEVFIKGETYCKKLKSSSICFFCFTECCFSRNRTKIFFQHNYINYLVISYNGSAIKGQDLDEKHKNENLNQTFSLLRAVITGCMLSTNMKIVYNQFISVLFHVWVSMKEVRWVEGEIELLCSCTETSDHPTGNSVSWMTIKLSKLEASPCIFTLQQQLIF